MIRLVTLLAQTTQPTGPPPPSAGDTFKVFLPLLLAMVVFWWIMSRSRSKEQKRYQAMLSAMKRNDRVQTIGGIIGTVVDVRDNEVVLKVDETNNVKMRFIRSAIKEVLQEAPKVDAKAEARK
jgi:preprotein translocase subunit YajC